MDKGASGKPDRAAGLRPQPPSASSQSSIPSAGDTFTATYPFVRDTYTATDEEGCHERQTWKPGVRFEPLPPYGEDTGAAADGEGLVSFSVVATFKPARYPMRVFFTRQFKSPEGKWFGKSKLHIVTLEKFRRLIRGYRYTYGIGEPVIERSVADAREWFERELAAFAQGIEAGTAETRNGVRSEGREPDPEGDAP